MNAQCPRCLSTSFKKLVAGDGDKPNCCTFCKDMKVVHSRSPGGPHRTVICKPVHEDFVSNVVPIGSK